jgi:hypothetical protein
MMKVLIVGCSYTKGHGLNLEIDDPILWANQLIKHIAPGSQITNLAKTGRDNHWIFTETCTALAQDDYDIVLVGWTEQSRLNFDIGLETYSTHTMFKDLDVNINPRITVPGKHLLNLGNELRKLQNDHWALLDLVKYVNILYDAQVRCRNKTLICVNSMLHMSENYFTEQEFTVPNELSEFQQRLLNVETRSDQEIKELYKLTHQQYRHYGGIRSEIWLNLYRSLQSIKVDNVSSTDTHPGLLSQDVFVKYLINQYNETSNNNYSRRSQHQDRRS